MSSQQAQIGVKALKKAGMSLQAPSPNLGIESLAPMDLIGF